jgi:hypothetical protein
MHYFFLTSMAALLLVCSCRGCDNGELGSSAGSSTPTREQQTEQAQLRARLAGRRLDRSKSYPKGDDDVVACGTDADCFLAQSEHCVPAVVTHTHSLAGYGIRERIVARYKIVGNDGGKCKLLRDTLALDAALEKALVGALKGQGKTNEDIEQMQADALETLREGNPERFECKLSTDQMLEAALGLAENLYDPQFWRLVCNEAELPSRNP